MIIVNMAHVESMAGGDDGTVNIVFVNTTGEHDMAVNAALLTVYGDGELLVKRWLAAVAAKAAGEES